MHPIQIDDAPVLLKRTLPPSIKLLGERLVETTDDTGARGDPHERLSHFSDFVRADSGDKHLRESLGHPGSGSQTGVLSDSGPCR
jgi:hypothetical protein